MKKRIRQKKIKKSFVAVLLVWLCVLTSSMIAWAGSAYFSGTGSGSLLNGILTYSVAGEASVDGQDDSLVSISKAAAQASLEQNSNNKLVIKAVASVQTKNNCGTVTGYAGTVTATVTIKNPQESGYAVLIDSVTVNSGSATILTEAGVYEGSFTLAPGKSFTVSVVSGSINQTSTSNSGTERTATVTVQASQVSSNELKLISSPLAAYSVGDYSVGTSGINVTDSLSAGTTITMPANDPVASGYIFYGWRLNDGRLLKAGESFALTSDVSVSPIFLSESNYTTDANGKFMRKDSNGKTSYGPFQLVNSKAQYLFWTDALYASKESGDIVKLVEDYALPATYADNGVLVPTAFLNGSDQALNYIIPKEYTVLVPYSDQDTGGVQDYDRNGGRACTTAHKTLTLNDGHTITTNGTLIVNGKVGGNSFKNEGTVYGTYGKMVVAGDIIVNGDLYARGYMVDSNHTSHEDNNGTGLIVVNGSGKVHMPLQILDYRGGNATKDVRDSIFPISMFKFQNIMLRTEYESGAKLLGQYFVSTSDNNGAQVSQGETELLGNSSAAFIQVSSGSLFTDYSYSKDQIIASADGDVVLNNLSISVRVTALSGIVDLTTVGKEVPIPYGLALKVLSGASLTTKANLKLLPGSWVEIQSGGNLEVSSESSIYLYDNSVYQTAWSYAVFSDGTHKPYLTIPGLIKSGINTWNNDAVVHVKGTVTINGSVLESTGHSHSVYGYPGGKLELKSTIATSGSINELVNADKSPTASTKWQSITGLLAGRSTSATNYVDFATSGTGDYYTTDVWASDTNAAWYQYTVSVANGTAGLTPSGVPTVGKAYTTSDTVAGYSVKNGKFAFMLGGGYNYATANGTPLAVSNGTYTHTVTSDTVIAIEKHVAKILGGTTYKTLSEAVAACGTDTYIQMIMDTTESLTANTSHDVYVDLAGKTVNLPGLSGSNKVYFMDRATDAYTDSPGRVLGEGATTLPDISKYTADGITRHYIKIGDAKNGYSFPRVTASVTGIQFAFDTAEKTGYLTFRGTFRGNSTAVGALTDLGFEIDGKENWYSTPEDGETTSGSFNAADEMHIFYTRNVATAAEIDSVLAMMEFNSATSVPGAVTQKMSTLIPALKTDLAAEISSNADLAAFFGGGQ